MKKNELTLYLQSMKDTIEQIKAQIADFRIDTKEQLEQFRLQFVNRKSVIADLLAGLKDIAPEERKAVGAHLNALKNEAQMRFDEAAASLENAQGNFIEAPKDLTLPPIPFQQGTRHPLMLVREEIIGIFERIGFNISEGPEIEDDWHNFTALNFPQNHPARDMQDTFFVEKNPDIALRTHTSSVQVRVMENSKPPIRTLSPGRVYRNEAISARAHCMFHQVEGLYIDKNVSFADLKQTLYYFVKELFGSEVKIRFRPSFFPFTEPSAEIDISCRICNGDGCQMCKHSGWVEIGGAGMVDPNVLTNNGINPDEYTGFAFGMGIERITNLKYQIRDLRLFTENDVRFLRQFTAIG